MVRIDFGLVGIVIGICLTFGGFLLSNKVTGFGASPQGLAGVSVGSIVLLMVPEYGMVVSLIGTFLMLRALSKKGVILMMVVSFVMTTLIIVGLTQIL